MFQQLISVLKRSFDSVLTRGEGNTITSTRNLILSSQGGEENRKLGFILGFLPHEHVVDINELTNYITKGDNGFDFVLNSSIFSQ